MKIRLILYRALCFILSCFCLLCLFVALNGYRYGYETGASAGYYACWSDLRR